MEKWEQLEVQNLLSQIEALREENILLKQKLDLWLQKNPGCFEEAVINVDGFGGYGGPK